MYTGCGLELGQALAMGAGKRTEHGGTGRIDYIDNLLGLWNMLQRRDMPFDMCLVALLFNMVKRGDITLEEIQPEFRSEVTAGVSGLVNRRSAALQPSRSMPFVYNQAVSAGDDGWEWQRGWTELQDLDDPAWATYEEGGE